MRRGGILLAAAAATAAALGCGDGAGAGPAGPTGPGEDAAPWLEAHDAVRAGTFAGVTLDPPPSPPLPPLAWSAAAAAIAQAWANQCVFEHNPGRGADGTPRGENLAATAPGGRADATPGTIVGLWGGEWADYDHATNACAAGAVCGHYTQLVWRGTLRVGCGRARCAAGSPFQGSSTWDLFVCDYEPPGNRAGERPY